MKIKPPIYFAAALAGVAALFLAPGWLGQELGLALGFALLVQLWRTLGRREPLAVTGQGRWVLALAAWAVGGVIAMLGALTFAALMFALPVAAGIGIAGEGRDELGADAGLGVDLERAAVRLDDGLGDRQAEAGVVAEMRGRVPNGYGMK